MLKLGAWIFGARGMDFRWQGHGFKVPWPWILGALGTDLGARYD